MSWTSIAPRILCLGAAIGCAEPADVRAGWSAPDNRWTSAAPPADLVGEGFEVGQVVPDLRLVDQHGDQVSLWQFWGEVVLINVSAMWCAPCHELALSAVEIDADLPPGELEVLTILEEDYGGLDPKLDDALRWIDALGVSGPVLLDPEHELSPALRGSYPAMILLDRSLEVASRDSVLSTAQLYDLIDSEL